jgi:hypothetical protein
MEVVDSEGTVSSNITKVLDKWKSEYFTLLNQQRGVIADGSIRESCSAGKRTFNDYLLTEPISYSETLFAIEKAKRGKSAGFDNLPSETFLNQCSVLYLHHLFDYCFTFGKILLYGIRLSLIPYPSQTWRMLKIHYAIEVLR